MTRRTWAVHAAGWAAAAMALAGCGTESPDLFEIARSGEDPAANVRIVVSDAGTVACNGEERPLDSERLLTARGLARDLAPQAALGIALEPAEGSQLRYRVRMEPGSVAFSDTSRGRPRTFDRVVAFAADIAENVCGIER